MIYGLLRFELKKNLKDKGLLFWMLILPILFIVLFGYIFDAMTHIIPGYTVMFTFFIMISMVINFVKDLQNGMVARLASTPLTKYQYLLGKWLPYIFIVLAQIFALLMFGYLVYGVELGNVAALFFISLALAVITTGWGLALSLITKNENMGIAFTQIIALGGAMIGGLWMPTEFLPQFVQTIGQVLPQYWAQQGFLEIMVHGGNMLDVALHILLLLLYGLLGLLVAAFGYRRFLAAARG